MRLIHSRRRAVLLTALALLLLLLGLLGVWSAKSARQAAKVRQLQQELFGGAARNLPPEERRARFEELRAATAKLTDGQRRELRAEAGQRRRAELARYFTLSKAEKTRYLDQQIDRMEEMRRNFAARGGPNGAGPNGGGPGAGPPRPRTPEEREQRRKQRLDETTPQERAQRDQFRHDLEARRSQRGLPPFSFGPGPR
jgi:hypothetical protein